MSLRESAMQAALKALEFAQQDRECPSTTRQAIAALRAALAEQQAESAKRVQSPSSVAEAKQMVFTWAAWLKYNAPTELIEPQPQHAEIAALRAAAALNMKTCTPQKTTLNPTPKGGVRWRSLALLGGTFA